MHTLFSKFKLNFSYIFNIKRIPYIISKKPLMFAEAFDVCRRFWCLQKRLMFIKVFWCLQKHLMFAEVFDVWRYVYESLHISSLLLRLNKSGSSYIQSINKAKWQKWILFNKWSFSLHYLNKSPPIKKTFLTSSLFCD